MNSAENEAVTFRLEDKESIDYLVVSFPDDYGKPDIEINLNDSATCQDKLRSLFAQLVEILIDKEISISFEKNEDYPRDLIESAIELYVDDLKNEIITVKQQICRELSTQSGTSKPVC